MKTRLFIAALFIAATSLVSCTKDEVNDVEGKTGSYIINYGSFGGAKSSITLFDTDADSTMNYYFESVNDASPESNYQYAYNYDGNIFFMGNEVDKVTYVDDQTFEQIGNGISDNIVKPRHCVANENTLYVSCWGGDIWIDNTLSYIAIIDLTTMSVSSKIELAGGAEGLAVVNGKLYAALNYVNKIAVIDLSTEAVTYIETPEVVSSYFIKDANDNLYVSLVTYGYSENSGLGYINTTTDELEIFSLDGMSTGYGSIMAANADFSKIYTVASSWVQEGEDWVQKGSVAVFDVASKAFESDMFVEGITGINGVAVDKVSGNIMVMISESVTSNGRIAAYKSDGTFVKEYPTGISPIQMLTIE